MDFALLSLLHGLLLAMLMFQSAPHAGRQRWQRRLHAALMLLLAVLCWSTLSLARPPGVPRNLGVVVQLLDSIGLLGLLMAVHALGAAPCARRLQRVGLGLGSASFCAAAGWFQLATHAQRRADPELSAALSELWHGTYSPAMLFCLVLGLASALFIAWGIAAPELHDEAPEWQRDNVMCLPTVTLLVLVAALLAI